MKVSVGIVLVSHSPRLAAGVAELLAQVTHDAVSVITAAGADDRGIGTSYRRIEKAIAEADHGAGVIVIPDLGSSVLTTRAVLADHPAPDVVLVDTPFVEGAIAIAAAVSAGADLAAVVSAAEEARTVRKF
jgi:phosphoenolpyruvate---glycerone phosphotransferase subunit DhaM